MENMSNELKEMWKIMYEQNENINKEAEISKEGEPYYQPYCLEKVPGSLQLTPGIRTEQKEAELRL